MRTADKYGRVPVATEFTVSNTPSWDGEKVINGVPKLRYLTRMLDKDDNALEKGGQIEKVNLLAMLEAGVISQQRFNTVVDTFKLVHDGLEDPAYIEATKPTEEV